MNQSVNRSRALRWILFSALAVVLLLAVGAYWGWNNRSHPAFIAGNWIMDDLRTEEKGATRATFYATGVYDHGDPAFEGRWRFADGQIHLYYWHRDSKSLIDQWLGETTIYSWFAQSGEFALVPEFNEDGTVMTLSLPGEKPHLRLRREGANPKR